MKSSRTSVCGSCCSILCAAQVVVRTPILPTSHAQFRATERASSWYSRCVPGQAVLIATSIPSGKSIPLRSHHDIHTATLALRLCTTHGAPLLPGTKRGTRTILCTPVRPGCCRDCTAGMPLTAHMMVLGVPVAFLATLGLHRVLSGTGLMQPAFGAGLAHALACSWCGAGSATARRTAGSRVSGTSRHVR